MEMELFPRMIPGKSRHVRRKKSIIMLCAVLVALVASFVAYYIITQNRAAREIAAQLAAEEELRKQQELEKSAYEAILNSQVFFDGITIDGVNVSGMTMEQARDALSTAVQSYTPIGTLQLTYEEQSFPFDLSTIPVALDTEAVLREAFNLARSDTYEEAKAELDSLKTNGRNLTLTAAYDFAAVSMRVSEIAAMLDTPATDAAIQFNADSEGKPYTISDEVVGVAVNQPQLVADITAAVQSGNYAAPIAIPVAETLPTVTRVYLEGVYTLRASAETSFAGSDSNRTYNIKKGAKLINGTVVKPGETFSTNAALGTRTYSNGWKEAGAYVGGAVDKQAGGGVCQLSSTLYNAVVKADLEVVSRRNHSMPVSYIKKGLDATINSTGNIIDFKFKNNTAADILIRAYTSGKNVIFELYGVPFATTEYDEIKLTSKQTDTIEPKGDMIETLDPQLAPGETQIKVARQTGSRWQSYKNYYLKGTLVRSEKLALSTYDAFVGEMLVGPELVITPTPTPHETATPTTPPVTTPEPTHSPTPTPETTTDVPIISP